MRSTGFLDSRSQVANVKSGATAIVIYSGHRLSDRIIKPGPGYSGRYRFLDNGQSCRGVPGPPVLTPSMRPPRDQPHHLPPQAEEITLTIGQAFDLAYKRFLSGKAAESEGEKIAR